MIIDFHMINGIFGISNIGKNINMKIFLFGSSGMLGTYVSKYLSGKYEVININRNNIDASTANIDVLKNLLDSLSVERDDVLINCIGTIKPRVDELGDLNAILVNSVFPHYLSAVSAQISTNLIHITTDCVFSGSRGSYLENDEHDITDVYGRTKSLGEPSDCTVIRTSIIGEEKGNARSLVEWVKSSSGDSVSGYTNHIWNGVTCLQLAKVIDEIVSKKMYWKGIRHVHSPTSINKYQLLNLLSKVYDLDIEIKPVETSRKCDRSLKSNFNIFSIPEIERQIQEMRCFKI